MDPDQTSSARELKSPLARYSLSAAESDGNFKLAWANSICFLFLLIGIIGARRGAISIKTLPPIREAVPVVVIPITLPPQKTVLKKQEQPRQPNQQPRVYVALPNTPNVNFSVPSIGTIVTSAAFASAPPLNPLESSQPITSVGNTGTGGDRPEPPYPPLAMQSGEQGTIVLLLNADMVGNVASIEVKRSSGFPYLDQATVAFIKNHWHLPAGTGTRLFQTSITYRLQF